MNEILISILIGLFIGILTNLIAWWILFHHIVPKIYFSHSISKIPTQEDKSGYKYRFKIQNLGKRPIIDVELIARIRLKGAGDFPRNIRIVDIPLSKKAISHRIPIIMSGDDTGKILKLFVNEVDEFRDLARYPDYIKIKSNEKILLLEDVLSIGSEATLQIFAFGYDEFSGSRKVFISKFYTVDDIKEGRFDFHGLTVKTDKSSQKLHPWERFKNL